MIYIQYVNNVDLYVNLWTYYYIGVRIYLLYIHVYTLYIIYHYI